MAPLGFLADWVRKALRSTGLDVQHYHALNFPNLRRQRILEHHGIDLVIDAGANVGQYATKLRENGYQGYMLSFEPSSAAFQTLTRVASRDKRWTCRREAVGAKAQQSQLFVAENSVSSSLLEATPALLQSVPRARAVGQESVQVVRIDDLAAELNLSRRKSLLKLDVQGWELEALRGAQQSLGSIELVEAEQSLIPLYVGDPSLTDLLGFLAQRGFGLISIEPNTLDPRSNHVVEINAMFARAPTTLAT